MVSTKLVIAYPKARPGISMGVPYAAGSDFPGATMVQSNAAVHALALCKHLIGLARTMAAIRCGSAL